MKFVAVLNVVHLNISVVEKLKFSRRSLRGKKVFVFLFGNCLHWPDQLLPAGGRRRLGRGEEERKRRKGEQEAEKGGEC